MPARPVLILVHGTGAGEPNPADRRWWESESQTAQDLAKASPDGPAELKPFPWSGRNSEKDRRAGGRALLEKLREYEGLGRDYRLIGHSHGGSVIWHALTESVRGEPLAHLKGWITVGTPFLRFRPAWLYLWVALAAAMAVFVASRTTTLLLAAWPDRVLVLQHAKTSDLFGYIVEAFVALTLAFVVLAVVTLALGLAVRAFPALRNIPRRVRFAIGAAVVLVTIGGATWFVVWSDLIRAHAPKAGLWATLALAALTWIVASFFVAATFLLIYRGVKQWRRDRDERAAVAQYGPLWQPFTHAFDETVAGLAASRVSPYPVAAPHPGPDASVRRQMFAIVLAPVARVADDFIWWMLMRRLQGADIWGLLLVQASAAPQSLALVFGFSHLTDPAAHALLDDAAKGLGELGSELRSKLVKAGEVPDAVSAVEIVGSAIKWTEVVHTLYFRDIRMMGQLTKALTEEPRAPLPVPAQLGPPSRAYGFLPLTIATCFVSFTIVWGLGQTVTAFHWAFVRPHLTATQVDIAASAWRSIETLAADRTPIIGEYLVRLVALGRLPDPAVAIRRIPEVNSQGAAAQRVAFAYGFAGRTETLRVFQGRQLENSFTGRGLRHTNAVHALAGAVAARRTPDGKLVQRAIDALRQAEKSMGLRELYCTAIPALFAAGNPAEAIEFFGTLQTLQGRGCDEAIDIAERQKYQPCIVQERIAVATALLGKPDDALDIAKTCDNRDRMRTVLLRLAIQVDDVAAATRMLAATEGPDSASANEIVLRAAALARLGRLGEANAVAKPVLDDPTKWFKVEEEKSLRPLFNVLVKKDEPGPLLDSVISAQERISKASDDLRISTYQGLELVRMLSEAQRSAALAAAGRPLISRVAQAYPLKIIPRALIDAAEAAILIGQTGAAGKPLSDALRFLVTTAHGPERPEQYARVIDLARIVSPALVAHGISQLKLVIQAESDVEERARLNSIVSGAYLKNGDPVAAIKFAGEAALPHRVIEAYCRILDYAIDRSAAKVAAPDYYGLKYPHWPAPSFLFPGNGNFAFRDAFGPQACEAPWPIDKRSSKS